MQSCSRWIRGLAAGLLLLSVIAAEAPAGLRELEIPVDGKQVAARAFSSDPLVRLSQERYRELVARWERAQRESRPTTAEAPLPFSAVEASYVGTAAAGAARFRARLVYHVLENGPAALPVCNSDVALESVTAGGGELPRLAAPGQDGHPIRALVDAKGPVTLEVTFSVPVETARGRSALAFRPVPFPVKGLEVSLPKGTNSAVLGGAAPSGAGLSGSGKAALLRADLGAAETVELQWYTTAQPSEARAEETQVDARARAAEEKPRLSVVSGSLFVIGDETLSMRHELEVLVTRGRVPALELTLPSSVDVQELTGPTVADWRTSVTGGIRRLKVLFREPLRGETRLLLTGYQVLGERSKVPLPFARVEGAVRHQGVFGVSSYCTLEMDGSGLQGPGVQAIDPGDLPLSLAAQSATPVLLAYRYPAAIADPTLGIKRFQPAPVLPSLVENANAVTILTDVDRDGGGAKGRQVTSFTKVILQFVNASRKYLTVRMAPEARVTSCFVGAEACSPALGGTPGEVLVPVPRSRVKDGKLEAVAVQLTYQLDLGVTFGDSGTIAYRLPSFDAPISDYSWKVFTPEKYRFLRFRGELEDTTEDAEFVLVGAAKWLFDRLLYDLVGKLVLGALLLTVLVVAIRGGLGALKRCAVALRGVLTSLLIVLFILGGLAAISVPNFRSARERANTRACFANQKTIAGAVEMYNLDSNCCRTDIGMQFLAELVKGGYLQSVPVDPGLGPNSGSNYYFTEDGNGIACRIHGTIAGAPAKIYGIDKDGPAARAQEAQTDGKGSSAEATPRDDRMNPINFRIPRTGQYTLLLRGFLPEGVSPGFEVKYYSAEQFLQFRMLCWSVGAALALLLVLPAVRRRNGGAPALAMDVAAVAGLLVALLGVDACSPVLAVECFAAWAAAAGVGLVVTVFGGELRRLAGKLEEGGDER
jgi:competence protein ComGC